MATLHQFGGQWTEEKLRRLQKYLPAYMTIFKQNPRARWFTTYYVDAFAGTGSRVEESLEEPITLTLFDGTDIDDVKTFYKGSAQVALESEPSFDHYIFVEKKTTYIQELEKLRKQYPNKADRILVENKEANDFLQGWCHQVDWEHSRAVVFLDPYGMSVNWSTLETIAQTKAIDLWILLPVGQAINRLLTKDGPPPEVWANKLTNFFGTDLWKEAFYQPRAPLQGNLFDMDEDEGFEKKANFESIGEFFIQRLDTIFEKVAPNPLALLNSKNVPIYLLFFAASNPIGAPTAIRIARDILKR